MTIIVDTNVISELARAKPNARVLSYMNTLQQGYLTTITLHELTYGIALKPDGRMRRDLEKKVNNLVSVFEANIIDIGTEEAKHAGKLRAQAHKDGRTLHLADALIAAAARVRSFSVLTRNVKDFDNLGFEVINPWNTLSGTAL